MTTTTQHPAPGKALVQLSGERALRVERVFNAPRERVWQAFTDPVQLAQWWGRGNTLVIEKLELHRGGHWRFVEHAEDGVHGFEGRFREVTPPSRLVQTFEWDGMPTHAVLNDTTFEDLGDGRTRLVTISTYFDRKDRDGMMQSGMEEGMNLSYEAVDRLLAAGAAR